MSPPLRVGLLLDTDAVPRWLSEGLRRCIGEGLVEVVVALIRNSTAEPAGRLRRHWNNRSTLFGRMALRLDHARTGIIDPPGEPLGTLAPACTRLSVTPIEGKFTDEFPPEALAAIRESRTDMLIREGFRILKGEILTCTRLGVLSFHHGDNRVNRGGPTGFWEVLLGEETSGLTIQVMSAELDGGRVLGRSVGRTVPYSFLANRKAIFARSAPVLERTIRRLQDGNLAPHGSAAMDPAWSAFDRTILRFPDNRAVLRGARRLVARRLGSAIHHRGTTHQWAIAWHFARTDTGGRPLESLRRYRLWQPPAGRFWADPFPIVGPGDRHWLFFEEYVYRVGRGTLRCVEFDRSGPVGEVFDVLDEPFHLSYPNVFRHEGEWYLVPEAAASGHLNLYRARSFPRRWELVGRLLPDVPLIDPTFWERDGTWYLFGSIADRGIGPDDELHLFVGPSPLGPFTCHPASPVVTDVRSARMAGRLFEVGDVVIRPAQIGVPRYGAGLAMRRIEELAPNAFRESPLQDLRPDWRPDAIGLHTINAQGNLSALDLRLRVPRGVGQP